MYLIGYSPILCGPGDNLWETFFRKYSWACTIFLNQVPDEIFCLPSNNGAKFKAHRIDALVKCAILPKGLNAEKYWNWQYSFLIIPHPYVSASVFPGNILLTLIISSYGISREQHSGEFLHQWSGTGKGREWRGLGGNRSGEGIKEKY